MDHRAFDCFVHFASRPGVDGLAPEPELAGLDRLAQPAVPVDRLPVGPGAAAIGHVVGAVLDGVGGDGCGKFRTIEEGPQLALAHGADWTDVTVASAHAADFFAFSA